MATSALTEVTPDVSVGARARRRIMRRVMPYLLLLYIIAFIDRVNVGYAALEMTRDLGFSPGVYGFGAGIFFLGYFFFEIPGSLLVETWSARKWISRIMVTWGVLAVLMGFIQNSTHFYAVRFLLGAAEAGFFPGVIVYLTHWFTAEDRAKAVAFFMAGMPIANIFGAPASGLLLDINWLGLEGWRWLFILEGLPAILFGVVTLFYLADRPHQAAWLPADEREWITAELKRERGAGAAARSHRVWEGFRRPEVVMLALAYFFLVTALYGFNFWLPLIIKNLSGLPNLLVTLTSALPYCVGLGAMLFAGWSSDRTKERRWHTAVPAAVAAAGLLLSALAQSSATPALTAFCLAAAGIYAFYPGFWSLPSAYLTGSAAAVAVGLINSFGNLGGFVGPFVVGRLNAATGTFVGGMAYLSASALLAAGFILALRFKRLTSR